MIDLSQASARECPVALNFVTLGPRRILMAEGCPATQAFFEEIGIACQTVEIDKLARAAGGIGCLTGILERDPVYRRASFLTLESRVTRGSLPNH